MCACHFLGNFRHRTAGLAPAIPDSGRMGLTAATSWLPHLAAVAALAVGGLVAACGDGGANSLTSGSGPQGEQLPSGPAASSVASSASASTSAPTAEDAGPPESKGE